MRWALDLAYLVAAIVASPIWLFRMVRTGKIRTDWPARFGRCRIEVQDGPRVLLHAVSVGEVNATRLLVDELARHPTAPRVIVASTTDTGIARARTLFGDRHDVVRYPFDFSPVVDRFLDTVRPDVVGLIELEVWPNFTARCAARSVPVCVINGRLTARSTRRYQRVLPLVRPTFRRLAAVATQNETYASRFARLGVLPERIAVTGTMKWDTAEIADEIDGATTLADSMGINRSVPLIVAGSTAPGEHELLHAATPDGVQLLCAPRKPEWFDQAAGALPGCARRSNGGRGSPSHRFLLDTIGELRMAYALADLVVIGRSFGDLHGSDMMEPIALGRATVVGPAVEDFQDTADALIEGGGLVQVTRDELPATLVTLLDRPDRRRDLAERGRAVVRAHQGATRRHVELLTNLLPGASDTNSR